SFRRKHRVATAPDERHYLRDQFLKRFSALRPLLRHRSTASKFAPGQDMGPCNKDRVVSIPCTTRWPPRLCSLAFASEPGRFVLQQILSQDRWPVAEPARRLRVDLGERP